MALNHQSPGYAFPSFRQKQVNTTTWGTGGNTLTITDTYLLGSPIMIVQVKGSTPAAGNWAYDYSVAGKVTITSSQVESSTLSLQYIIL